MTPCREYQGQRNKGGYGVRSRSQPQLVHRWVWERIHGLIPLGIFILHKCDNPPCFRYDHLFDGTNQDNMNDMVSKGRARGIRPTRLTPSQVTKIRLRYDQGESQSKLAVEFGVTQPSISDVVRLVTWKDVT